MDNGMQEYVKTKRLLELEKNRGDEQHSRNAARIADWRNKSGAPRYFTAKNSTIMEMVK
jgi:hypothetical protein